MTASQLNIISDTPMGGNLVPGGATFRTWAPNALEVYIALQPPAGAPPGPFPKNPSDLLVKHSDGYWTGFVPGLRDGDLYRFYAVGKAEEGFKRDPYARELEFNGYPDCDCILRDP
jgi:1,4-alpha-glucan branching enzyme